MESLPPEVLQIILCCLGGQDFVKFRTVSKWTRAVSSDLEERAKPTIWQKFVFSDFLQPCVESVAPWVYSSDVNDVLLWKELYIRLHRTWQLTRVGRKAKIINNEHFSEGGVKLVSDVKFIYGFLFLISTDQCVNLMGIADQLRLRAHCKDTDWISPLSLEDDMLLAPVTLVQRGNDNYSVVLKSSASSTSKDEEIDDVDLEVCEPPDNFAKSVGLSVWTDTCIVYQKQFLFDEEKFKMYNYKDINMTLNRIITLSSPVTEVLDLSYNQDRIALITAQQKICLFSNLSTHSVPVFEFSLPQPATKIQMLGDFILCLMGDGVLETCQVITDKDNKISLSKWTQMDLSGHAVLQDQDVFIYVVDFVLQGHIFAFTTRYGLVFVSYMDTLTLSCLLRNLKCVHQLHLDSTGFIFNMAVDQQHGPKFAIIERYFDEIQWVSKVHVFELG
ncbi:uncharacterized protein LOC106067045 isoform X1 [Biomphalaria glabrata]|uniref:Uncharacterized protein LOC106067045 isoform X1 n=2 Tax=Biomphalaria glabrata TaxID=6526 RepID=A0A9W3A9L9_BIOGL|nr:uncharacterized protein LOC106067045 isoform X1 [Biomphalaria glabrata]